EGPHEFEAWQLTRLVPCPQGWIHIEFRILNDLVAKAINDHADSVDAPDPFVKTLLCHQCFSFRNGIAHLMENDSLVLYHIYTKKSMFFLTFLTIGQTLSYTHYTEALKKVSIGSRLLSLLTFSSSL